MIENVNQMKKKVRKPLTPEQRKERARKAIKARWERDTSTPEERAERARKAAAERWKGTSKKERTAHAKHMASFSDGRPRDPYQVRCPCGLMTLRRAEARGHSAKHAPTCSFYPAPRPAKS